MTSSEPTQKNWYEALHAFEKIFGVKNPLREGEDLHAYYIRAGDLYRHYREFDLEPQIRGFVLGFFGDPPIERSLTLVDRVSFLFSLSMRSRLLGVSEGYGIGVKARELLQME